MPRWMVIAFLTCLLVVGQAPAARALDNRELKIAVTQEFETLNPLVMQMAATSFIYRGSCKTPRKPAC